MTWAERTPEDIRDYHFAEDCDQQKPCDVMVLLAEIERLRAALESVANVGDLPAVQVAERALGKSEAPAP